MLILITGNPNSGKTSLINLLKTDGYNVFNVDDFVHEIYQVNQIGYILIQTHFGKEYLTHKQVDRKKLKDLIINNDYEMYRLKILIWPLIKSKLYWLKNHFDLVIVEMAIFKIDPLYFNNIFDYIIEIKPSFCKEKNNEWSNIFNHQHLCYLPNKIIENKDLLDSYDQVKEIINSIKEKK